MKKVDLNFDKNNKTKSNHYVPQVYLKFFEKDINNLFVLDKITKNIFNTNTINIGVKNKLYVIEDKNNNIYQSWEDYYTKNVDNFILPVFNKIINNTKCAINIKPLNDLDLKLELINIMIHQLLRSPEKVYSFWNEYPNEIDDILNDPKIKEKSIQFNIKQAKKILNQEYVYKSIALPMINNVANNNIIKRVLLNKTWTVFCNYTNINFITSDNPVVIYDYKNKIASTKNGIASEATLIAYPISPKYMIVLFPNEYLVGGIKLFNNCRIPCYEEKVINSYNIRQLLNASKQIYSTSENELKYLKNISIK